ncbi:hypothetical protein AVEN_139651-1 [Araneus ventricosus]|uniref:Uncharacterized protein n=1 Tax=Araneus ventricosus TaxID=182803 RepID=A0A4Y2FUJ1_ARAVE|nr:hypothetical protein AVEN_139651-1 [Araneus ventricosus]
MFWSLQPYLKRFCLSWESAKEFRSDERNARCERGFLVVVVVDGVFPLLLYLRCGKGRFKGSFESSHPLNLPLPEWEVVFIAVSQGKNRIMLKMLEMC